MNVERITSGNIESRIEEIAALGNRFLQSIGQNPNSDPDDDRSVIRTMIEAKQTEIFLSIASDGKAVGISYFNVGTGFSCRGTYLWINGVFVLPEYRNQGHGSSLLAEIEKFGEAIGSQLIISSRDIKNRESQQLFASCHYQQDEQIVIKKETI